ncbi:hypothetical protein SISNIDRAFT_492544 [Sistotremastrum niveocremeum HHB9708]|uniref:Uncharacterized protein n=1 Tax=Sistotremastrum niveocremeum HHB9708 TaxID=1314777 RepID=A0A164ZVT0_9AGAM|nr:hypothetical protein SISNIDRAFT_492544 [Sistotremastrum niveocremeum HHB9708]
MRAAVECFCIKKENIYIFWIYRSVADDSRAHHLMPEGRADELPQCDDMSATAENKQEQSSAIKVWERDYGNIHWQRRKTRRYGNPYAAYDNFELVLYWHMQSIATNTTTSTAGLDQWDLDHHWQILQLSYGYQSNRVQELAILVSFSGTIQRMKIAALD